jgi:hypothetical protein
VSSTTRSTYIIIYIYIDLEFALEWQNFKFQILPYHHVKLPAKHFAVALAQYFGCEQQLLKQSADRPTNHGTKHFAA